MNKFFLAMILSVFVIAGCDNSTAPIPETKNTVTKVFQANKFTKVVEKKDSAIVIGSIQDADSKIGARLVVCSDVMRFCSRTNSKGVYSLSMNSTTLNLFAGRIFNEDTVTTPENVTPTIQADTTYDTTSFVISDTTVDGNTVNIIDSVVTEITETITEVSPTPVNDTLTVVNNGTILREVPIDSWGFILPPNYIVQRDISALDSTWDGSIKNVEVVYFMTGDSVAKVLTLGNSGGKYFSGFIYTFYDSMSFKNDTKIYNLFVRGLDSLGNVIVKTEIETFSERFGDIQTKLLKNKVGVPQWKILPKFIPAAKNNKKLDDAVNEYKSTEDTTINWVRVTELPVTYKFVKDDITSSYRFDIRNDITTLYNLYDSIVCTVNTNMDTVNVFDFAPSGAVNTIPSQKNVDVKISTRIILAQKMSIHSWLDYNGMTFNVSDIRFYLKK